MDDNDLPDVSPLQAFIEMTQDMREIIKGLVEIIDKRTTPVEEDPIPTSWVRELLDHFVDTGHLETHPTYALGSDRTDVSYTVVEGKITAER